MANTKTISGIKYDIKDSKDNSCSQCLVAPDDCLFTLGNGPCCNDKIGKNKHLEPAIVHKSLLSDIFNKSQELEKEFRRYCGGRYPATEIAYINRFLNGEKGLIGSFSKENLAIVRVLKNN